MKTDLLVVTVRKSKGETKVIKLLDIGDIPSPVPAVVMIVDHYPQGENSGMALLEKGQTLFELMKVLPSAERCVSRKITVQRLEGSFSAEEAGLEPLVFYAYFPPNLAD